MAERVNRTILEGARTLLIFAKLPGVFWSEAIAFFVHVRNRVTSSVTPDKPPFELWTGVAPDLSKLRVFGCLVYAFVPEPKRSKLSPKATKAMMVGFDDSGHYKLYDVEKGSFFYSSHVVFDEDVVGLEAIKKAPLEPLYTAEEMAVPTVQPVDKQPTEPVGASVEESLGLRLELSDSDDELDHASVLESADEGSAESSSEDEGEVEIDMEVVPPQLQEAPPAPPQPVQVQPSSSIDAPVELGGGPKRPGRRPGSTSKSASVPSADQSVPGKRVRKKPDYLQVKTFKKFASYLVSAMGINEPLGEADEPKSFLEAMSSAEKEQWIKAMDEEYHALLQNGTWVLSVLPLGRKPVGCKWVYKLKLDANGKFVRLKASLVAQGFTQKPGVDFKETFAPVARLTSLERYCI